MPQNKFNIKDNKTGKSFVIDWHDPTPPTEDEIDEILSSQSESANEQNIARGTGRSHGAIADTLWNAGTRIGENVKGLIKSAPVVTEKADTVDWDQFAKEKAGLVNQPQPRNLRELFVGAKPAGEITALNEQFRNPLAGAARTIDQQVFGGGIGGMYDLAKGTASDVMAGDYGGALGNIATVGVPLAMGYRSLPKVGKTIVPPVKPVIPPAAVAAEILPAVESPVLPKVKKVRKTAKAKITDVKDIPFTEAPPIETPLPAKPVSNLVPDEMEALRKQVQIAADKRAAALRAKKVVEPVVEPVIEPVVAKPVIEPVKEPTLLDRRTARVKADKQKLGRTPTVEEIVKDEGITPAEAQQVIKNVESVKPITELSTEPAIVKPKSLFKSIANAQLDEIIKDLDARNAPDAAYRNFSPKSAKLGEGETWRSKAIGRIDKTALPPVEPVVIKPRPDDIVVKAEPVVEAPKPLAKPKKAPRVRNEWEGLTNNELYEIVEGNKFGANEAARELASRKLPTTRVPDVAPVAEQIVKKSKAAPKERRGIPDSDTLGQPTAKKWARQAEELDAINAPDEMYRDIIPNSENRILKKKGQTWRGQVLEGIDYYESFAKKADETPVTKVPDVEPVVSKAKTNKIMQQLGFSTNEDLESIKATAKMWIQGHGGDPESYLPPTIDRMKAIKENGFKGLTPEDLTMYDSIVDKMLEHRDAPSIRNLRRLPDIDVSVTKETPKLTADDVKKLNESDDFGKPLSKGDLGLEDVEPVSKPSTPFDRAVERTRLANADSDTPMSVSQIMDEEGVDLDQARKIYHAASTDTSEVGAIDLESARELVSKGKEKLKGAAKEVIGAFKKEKLPDVEPPVLKYDAQGLPITPKTPRKQKNPPAEIYGETGTSWNKKFMEQNPKFKNIMDPYIKERSAEPAIGKHLRDKFEHLKDYTKSPEDVVRFQKEMQAGQHQDVAKYFDDIHDELTKRKIKLGYKDDYLPQLWDNTPEEIAAAFGDKQMNATASFQRKSIIKDYETGVAKGLKPKMSPVEMIDWYGQRANKLIADTKALRALRKEGYLLRGRTIVDGVVKKGRKKPAGWTEMDSTLGETFRDHYVDPRVKEVIEGYLKSDERQSKVLAKGASVTGKMANVALSAGLFPNKPVATWHGASIARRAFGEGGIKAGIKAVKYGWNPEKAAARLKEKGADIIQYTREFGYKGGTETHGGYTDKLFEKGLDKPVTGKVKKGLNWLSEKQNKNFERPLFDKTIPAIKLEMFERNFENFQKQGMSRAEAGKAAVEISDDFASGKNIDLLYNNKNFNNVARILTMAPDWLRSSVALGYKVPASFFQKGPKAAVYRKAGLRLLGSYAAANLAQKALTGKYMVENGARDMFNFSFGEDENGKKRMINIYGSSADPFKIMGQALKSSTEEKGSFGSVISDATENRLSPPVSMVKGFLDKEDYKGDPNFFGSVDRFGHPVPLGQRLKNTLHQTVGYGPPQLVAPYNYAVGNMGLEESISKLGEFPLVYRNKKKNPFEFKSKP